MPVELVVQTAVTLAGAVAAYFVLRTKVSRDAQLEADRLLRLRNERIQYMESELVELRARVSTLETHLDYVESQKIEVLARKVAEILVHKTPDIQVVAERLRPSDQ